MRKQNLSFSLKSLNISCVKESQSFYTKYCVSVNRLAVHISILTNDFFFCFQANQNPQDPQLLKIINLTAIAIRRLIKMSKKINAFKNMCQEDQLALLKGGCTEMMILRSVMQYDDCDRCTWKVILQS